MFLTMGVGLYTSRLVLQALGVIDYGIYGLVGGIVTSFAFLNSAMVSSTLRYLSSDIGRKDSIQLQKTFNATLNIHIAIALIVIVLSETLGLWFVNKILDIPANRLVAANWVYQFSIIAFVLEIIQVPYNALLIARERMNIYAYISILETILKLIIVLILTEVSGDKLIVYSVSTFVVIFTVRTIYKIYCKKYFKETAYHFYYDRLYYKKLVSYSGWNLFGGLAMVTRGQGSNILLNIFFGPVANAAFGISTMVQGIIGGFVSNFQMAASPQIIKNYALGEKDKSLNLIYKSAKFSFFGMLIIVIPLLANLSFILHLWLKNLPQYTLQFTKLALIYSLVESIVGPLATGAQAHGDIKWYQIIVGLFIIFIFPCAYLIFLFDKNPVDLYWIFIANSIVAIIFRLFFLKKMIGLDIKTFNIQVGTPVLILATLGLIISEYLFSQKADTVAEFILQSLSIILIVLSLIIVLGTSAEEKKFGVNFLKSKF